MTNADKQQQADRAWLAAIVESSNDAIVAKDLKGTVLSWNRSAEDLFGYSAEEMVGRPMSSVFPANRLGEEATILERIGRGERVDRYLTERRRKDGRIVRVSVMVSPVRDADGTIVAASTIIRDMTESEAREQHVRELQAELVHVQRLNELGQLVSALVHEVNQPLTAITNYLGAARRLLATGNLPPLEQVLDRIDGQTNRTRDIVQRIRDFVRKRHPELRSENLSQVVNEAIELTRASSRDQGLTLTARVDPDIAVQIDRVQVQQVLFNLLRNGIEAMQAQPHRAIAIEARPGASRMVEVSVADSGPGLPPEVRDKLFQPFVTTKSDGMGVGLSVCRTIVEAHAGQLWLEAAADGDGAVFRFTLPLAGADWVVARTV